MQTFDGQETMRQAGQGAQAARQLLRSHDVGYRLTLTNRNTPKTLILAIGRLIHDARK